MTSLRQPPSSPMNSEAHSREVLTVWAEQEVKPLHSASLCGDLSSTLQPLPKPRSVLGMGRGGRGLWTNLQRECGHRNGLGLQFGSRSRLCARWHLPGCQTHPFAGWFSFPGSPPSPPPLASVHGAIRTMGEDAATCR